MVEAGGCSSRSTLSRGGALPEVTYTTPPTSGLRNSSIWIQLLGEDVSPLGFERRLQKDVILKEVKRLRGEPPF